MKKRRIKKRFLAMSLFSTAGLAVVPSVFAMTKTEQNQTIKPKIIKPTKKDWGFDQASPTLQKIVKEIFNSKLINKKSESIVTGQEHDYAKKMETEYLPELYGVKNENQLNTYFQNQINDSVFDYQEVAPTLKNWKTKEGVALKKETVSYLKTDEELANTASVAVVYGLMAYLKTQAWNSHNVLVAGDTLNLCLQNFSDYYGPKINNQGDTDSLIPQMTNWIVYGMSDPKAKIDFGLLMSTNFAKMQPVKFTVIELYNEDKNLYGSETFFQFKDKDWNFISTVNVWNDDRNSPDSPEPFINPQMWFYGFTFK